MPEHEIRSYPSEEEMLNATKQLDRDLTVLVDQLPESSGYKHMYVHMLRDVRRLVRHHAREEHIGSEPNINYLNNLLMMLVRVGALKPAPLHRRQTIDEASIVVEMLQRRARQCGDTQEIAKQRAEAKRQLRWVDAYLCGLQCIAPSESSEFYTLVDQAKREQDPDYQLYLRLTDVYSSMGVDAVRALELVKRFA